MNRGDLYVFHITATVRMFVLDANIRELDAIVQDRQVVLGRPLFDFFTASIGPAIAIRAIAVSLLQELLVLALQFVVEDDAFDARAARLELLRGPQVRPEQLRVMRELTALDGAGIERLYGLRIAAAMALEQLATAFVLPLVEN